MSVGCSFFPSDSNNAIKQKQFNFCLWFLRCLNECDLLATFVAVLLCFFVCFEWKGDRSLVSRWEIVALPGRWLILLLLLRSTQIRWYSHVVPNHRILCNRSFFTKSVNDRKETGILELVEFYEGVELVQNNCLRKSKNRSIKVKDLYKS